MTRVEFYVLKRGAEGSHRALACRIAEKAYVQGRRIYIHTEDAAQAAEMDALLWSFRAGSFVPHRCVEAGSGEEPVLIGHGDAPEVDPDVLINLAAEVPLFFSRFQRVAELVEPGESQRLRARERFRFYRERGYELATHELSE